jgi:hypothetical protein
MVITLGLPGLGSHPHALIVITCELIAILIAAFSRTVKGISHHSGVSGARSPVTRLDPRPFRDDYHPGTLEAGVAR